MLRFRAASTVLFVMLWGLPAFCAHSSDEWIKREATLGKLDSQLQQHAMQIKRVQGNGACKKDEHCKVLGLGGKVCDLHRDFLIYSTQDANEELLRARVVIFNRIHQKVLDKVLASSSCGTKPVPIHCVSNRCVPIVD